MARVDFENLLKNTMGLDTASVGSASIERAVRRRMASVGLKEADDYWRELHSSTNELQELIEAVVVPETWFFRDREAFGALVRVATEEWQPSHPNSVLRLLSAPCSSGEEPYSMVMSLLDGGFAPQQLHVDAVDISSRALERATRGVYGSNSFRGESLAFRERYFEPAGNDYVLAAWLRELVAFRQRNLLSPDFGLHQKPYDVIFCRNLLIYFDRPTQELAMKALARLLTPNGFLFVGPAEAFLASCSGFESLNRSMAFAFRKTGAPRMHSELSRPQPGKHAKREPKPPSPKITTSEHISGSAPIAPAPATDLEAARRLADAGRLQEAAAWCEANLTERGPSSGTYFLLGLVSDAMGDRNSAATFYKKVIYLEPEHVEALMQLALISESQGNSAAAERLRGRARRAERDGGTH